MSNLDKGSDFAKDMLNFSDSTNKNINEYLSKIEHIKVELKNESLKKEIVEYRTNINFRGKNALGALMLNSAYVRLNKEMKVLDLDIKDDNAK
jgi:hypothetical protein